MILGKWGQHVVLAVAVVSTAGAALATPADGVRLTARLTGNLWCVRVDGNRQPVRLLLRNLTPEVQDLEGGPSQEVVTRGGEEGAVCRQVTRTAPGPGLLAARVLHDEVTAVRITEGDPSIRGGETPGPRESPGGQTVESERPSGRRWREAWKIARRLAVSLAPVRRSFTTARDELTVVPRGPAAEPAYRLPQVMELIDRTEADLLAALDQRELAALRDYVETRLRRARAELSADAGQASRPPARGEVRLARMGPDAGGEAAGPPGPLAVERDLAERILDGLAALLDRLQARAAHNDLALDLCIESAPREGFKFLLYPESYRRGARQTRTHGRLKAVYRGLYAYSMSRRGYRPVGCPDPEEPQADCALLDFWDDDRPILRCELVSASAGEEEGGCRRLDGNAEECGHHEP